MTHMLPVLHQRRHHHRGGGTTNLSPTGRLRPFMMPSVPVSLLDSITRARGQEQRLGKTT